MKKLLYYLLFPLILTFIILGSVILYFITITFDQIQMNPLYDVPRDKLWAHQANTIERAHEAIQEFSGIEFDVIFDDNLGDFDVRHGVGMTPAGLNLEQYFSSIPHPEMYYYWIDFKNLDKTNEKKALERMKSALNKFDLFDRVIVESTNPDSLNIFSREGIYTSYWIPHFEYKEGPFLKRLYRNYKLASLIRDTLELSSFNAISAHYPMYEFMNRYFPNSTIHLWTNGLETESDKAIIESLAKQSNIKVILVDYKENFLKK